MVQGSFYLSIGQHPSILDWEDWRALRTTRFLPFCSFKYSPHSLRHDAAQRYHILPCGASRPSAVRTCRANVYHADSDNDEIDTGDGGVEGVIEEKH